MKNYPDFKNHPKAGLWIGELHSPDLNLHHGVRLPCAETLRWFMTSTLREGSRSEGALKMFRDQLHMHYRYALQFPQGEPYREGIAQAIEYLFDEAPSNNL